MTDPFFFYFKCHAGHYSLPIDDYVKLKGFRLIRHSSDQDVLIPKCRTKLFKLVTLTVLLNSGIVPESTRTLNYLNQ